MGFNITSYTAPLTSIMNTNSLTIAQTIEQMSSGLRINSAADDPAGLAMSQMFTSQINGLNQGAQNIQSTMTLAQTASGALSESQSILQRMSQLATQANNSTNTSSDLNAIQSEMNQLATQLTTISNSTTYNGISLLSGAFQNQSFQMGAGPADTLSFSIGALDAATLGVASSTATITNATNTAGVQSLVGAGSGLQGNGEQYTIGSTTLAGGVGVGNGTIFNAGGAASTTASAAANKGAETMGLSFNAGGTFTGTTGSYQVQVTSVNASGVVTGIQYQNLTASPGTWTALTSNNGSFTVNGNLVASFTNPGAATAQAGDQFLLSATSGNTLVTIQGTQASGLNVGNETTLVQGTYSGTGNVQYAVKAAQTGVTGPNNPVTQVEVSTDGGHTWGSPITATEGVNPASGTATHFSIGNGLTFQWTPGTLNNSAVATNGDAFSFNAIAGNSSAQLLQLSDSTQMGGSAKYAGALANIGGGALVTGTQNTATVGTGAQAVTANFTSPGITGGLTNGGTSFTVTTPQAATVANGSVLANAVANAGPNIMTSAGATSALNTIDNAINTVSLAQGRLGAIQNQLTDAMSGVTNTSENLTTANTNLTGANIAQDMVSLTQAKINEQASVAMLAQANQIGEMVLKLLN